MSLRNSPILILLAALAIVAAACSGGSSSASDTSTTTSAAVTTTTQEFEPLPTSSTTTTEAPTTTTTAPKGPVAPLTGLPVDEPVTRPALVIKIDNHALARPQWGINAADVVYEEVVEGKITRLAAVFNSTDADPVGPVRSARTSDFDILSDLNTPLFANSGGNAIVLRLLRSVDKVNANVNALPNLFYRERSRRAPHNLLTRTADLWDAKGEEGGTPPALFEYREEGEELPASAEDVIGVDIAYGGRNVSYDWDPEAQGWARLQEGTPHVDADGLQVAPPNVVIKFIAYGRSVADPTSPEAILVGEGEAWVFTDGKLIRGRWSRPTKTDVTVYTDENGDVIKLTPGRTWIALPRPGQATLRQ